MRTTPKLSDAPNAAGSWEIVWSERRASGWRSMRRSTRTADYGLALQVLARFLRDRADAPALRRYTVADAIDTYLEMWSKPRGNLRTDRNVLRPVRAELGHLEVRAVTQDDVDAYVRRRTRSVAPSTARREVVGLQAALNSSTTAHMREREVRFQKPQDGDPRVLWLDEAQEKLVLSRLHTTTRSVALFIRMGLAYGARKGAMLDLRFGPQVSFGTGTVDFNVPGARRTRKRRPVGPMTPEIRHDLTVLFQRRGDGAHVLDRTVVDDFRAYMTGLGLGWATAHVLKHTAITLPLRGGAREEAVAKATATDVQTIRAVYRHFTADEMLETMGRRRA